jgi:hypothetical protein
MANTKAQRDNINMSDSRFNSTISYINAPTFVNGFSIQNKLTSGVVVTARNPSITTPISIDLVVMYETIEKLTTKVAQLESQNEMLQTLYKDAERRIVDLEYAPGGPRFHDAMDFEALSNSKGVNKP